MSINEQQLAEELQTAHNIEKIRRAVEKVTRQREVENRNTLDFDNLSYEDIH